MYRNGKKDYAARRRSPPLAARIESLLTFTNTWLLRTGRAWWNLARNGLQSKASALAPPGATRVVATGKNRARQRSISTTSGLLIVIQLEFSGLRLAFDLQRQPGIISLLMQVISSLSFDWNAETMSAGQS